LAEAGADGDCVAVLKRGLESRERSADRDADCLWGDGQDKWQYVLIAGNVSQTAAGAQSGQGGESRRADDSFASTHD
jgi:hypothetical protein